MMNMKQQLPPLRSPGAPKEDAAPVAEPLQPKQAGMHQITPEMLGFRSADESCGDCAHYEGGMCGMGQFQCDPEDGCIRGFSGSGGDTTGGVLNE